MLPDDENALFRLSQALGGGDACVGPLELVIRVAAHITEKSCSCWVEDGNTVVLRDPSFAADDSRGLRCAGRQEPQRTVSFARFPKPPSSTVKY